MSAEASRLPPGDDSATEPARPTLLFVDDEPAILSALRVVFRRGYQVLATTDGEEALQLMATRRVDVIVCDQRMPKITGVEVLSRARSISPSTVRLLLTGYADSEAVMGAINDGEVHRFLQKPWDNDALRASVEQAVAMGAQTARATETVLPQAPSLSPIPAAPMPPTPAPVAQIVPFPPAERAREWDAQTPPDVAGRTATALENVLIVERDGRLHRELSGTAGDSFSLLAARDISEASTVIERQPARVIVFVLDAQSAFERSFLKLLKIEHPGIIVIAVCEALDTPHMIELINHARIFRFLRYPVATALLVRHLQSAAALARQLHEQPLLLGSQRVSFDAAESRALFEALRTSRPVAARDPGDGRAAKPGWRDRLAVWLRRR